jgi:hypothetical protein
VDILEGLDDEDWYLNALSWNVCAFRILYCRES